MAHQQTEVLIVGAGPTGLLLATLLVRSGIRVRIIDKSPTAAKESRAFVIQARTMEYLGSIGLADRFLDRGVLATGARIYLDGQVSGALDLDLGARSDTPYPIILNLPQSETEAILVEHLASLGAEVERGVVATGLVQDGQGVSVATGAGEIRAAYCVGADGAHSFVRKAIGLTFEGAPYGQSFLLADCLVTGPLQRGPMQVFFHGANFALFFPLHDGRVGRVIATQAEAAVDPAAAAQGSAPAELAEVEAAFRRATNLDVRLSDPTWTSRYRVHHRGVNRYAVGRVFVAGDAAHIHSPAAGQGMNTGLGDAANLAWKLALALRGRAPDGLLESYDAERRPVGDTVLKATDRMFSAVTASSGWKAVARDLLIPLLGRTVMRSGALRSRAFHFMSELGIRYEAGDEFMAERDPLGFEGGPAPGRRAPDAAIARHLTIFDLIGGYRFTLLALSREALGAEEIDEVGADLDALSGSAPVDLATRLVGRSLIGRAKGMVQAETGAAFTAYGLGDGVPRALYLIRPDGHVAWRAPGFDVAAAGRVIAERFAAGG